MNKNALEKLLSSVEFQINDSSERKEFIDRVADALMVQLDNIDTDSKEETLIEYLMAKGLFPTFAFPLDVAVFEAKGTKKKKITLNFPNRTYMQGHRKILKSHYQNMLLVGKS